jgi:hypothetical protein
MNEKISSPAIGFPIGLLSEQTKLSGKNKTKMETTAASI